MKTFRMRAFISSLLVATTALAQADKDELGSFKKALEQYKSANYEKAIPALQEVADKKTDLQEYAYYYLAQSYFNLKELDKSQAVLAKLDSLSPNIKMSIDSSILSGKIALENKSFKQASLQFTKLEKRTHFTENYQEIIYNLALAQKGLKNHAQTCKWLVKLYEKYPAFEKVNHWKEDLAANEFAGSPSGCATDVESFRTRVRYLLWAGLDQKAQSEIDSIKLKIAKTDPYTSDKIQAQFYLQEGELSKAVDLLTPYYESKKKNFEFLILYASACARAGEVQRAVGTYYSAYKMSPGSKTGRQALYQAAFLSYQFQDYDGAARRFREFMQVYPNSGLNKDAKWHLAWLKYLKADYEGAYKAFAELQTQKVKSKKITRRKLNDRVTYWMAMSLLRQGKIEPAKNKLEVLAKDPLLGYYAIAAQARLKKIDGLILVKEKVSPLPTQPRVISRFSASEFLMPSIDENYRGDEAESEDDLILSQYSADEDQGDNQANGDEVDNTESTDNQSVEVTQNSLDKEVATSSDKTASFSSPQLMKRFERARDLVILGENEWARWDLYDIERKTSSREYLRTLMSEYSTAGQFNRSSYIAQITFGNQRAAHGLEGVRYLWELAYPRAFSDVVEKYTKKFTVPEELVWGIMRAESSYRRDAISPVGALGLMQVMPFTAHKVANLIGEKEFEASMLMEPESAVKMGSRYLKRLMDRFENTIPLVAAGYNAGPHRVKNWLVSFGNLDTDEFIEHIPFLETRNYVKRVVSNAFVYAQLYGNKKELFPYLSEPIPVKVNSEIVGKENWDEI